MKFGKFNAPTDEKSGGFTKKPRDEQGIAAFDSFADAQRFCRVSKKQLDRHALKRQNKLNGEETS